MSRPEAHLSVRRNDEGQGKRSRWVFFSSVIERVKSLRKIPPAGSRIEILRRERIDAFATVGETENEDRPARCWTDRFDTIACHIVD